MFEFFLALVSKDPLGYGLAFVCLILAIIEFFHGRTTKRELAEAKIQIDALKKAQVDEGKTTRAENAILLAKLKEQEQNVAVAKFPNNLAALTEFILGTKHDLSIMVDSLGYALYSNPSEFEAYLNAIQTILEKGCEVRLLLYSVDTLRKAVARQIPAGHKGEFYEKREQKSDRFRTFFEGKTIPESYEEFRDILLEKEQDLMATVPKAKVKIADRTFSAFCWIRDSASMAMFCLPE